MAGRPSRGLFVTGTGTEVGKTVVAAVIARAAAGSGQRVAVFKPAVSGLDDCRGRSADHELLRSAAGSAQSDDEIAPYRYGPPVSPHLGAELAGQSIDPARLRAGGRLSGGGRLPGLRGRRRLPRAADAGLPRPRLRARPRPAGRGRRAPGLGTINHTLLTLEAVRAAGLELVAVVLTPWPDDPDAVERSNRETDRAAGRRPGAERCRGWTSPGRRRWPELWRCTGEVSARSGAQP